MQKSEPGDSTKLNLQKKRSICRNFLLLLKLKYRNKYTKRPKNRKY